MTRPLSVQLYTLREELAADRAATVSRIAEIGYAAVEAVQPTDDPEGLRALLDSAGLAVSATHCPLHKGDPEEIVAAAKTLGTDQLIVPAGIEHDEFTTRDGLERTAALLNRLSKEAAGEGMLVGYHNHWWEFEPIVEGKHALVRLADLLDRDVFLEIDTYWAAVGGANVVKELATLGERVKALHIKDGPVVKGEPHTAVGAGRMPVPEIIAAVPESVQLVVELDNCATDMFTAIAESYDYLATFLAEDAT